MAKQTVITWKKLGPAPTGKGTLVGVRLQPAELNALDAWIERQREEISRPEAVRQLLRKSLTIVAN